MKTEQLSIFLENRAGRFAEVTATLAANAINILALSLADTSDFGILRLIVDNRHKAAAELIKIGVTIGVTSVVAVEIPDSPGGLNSVLQLVSGKNINVEYVYACANENPGHSLMIFRFDDNEAAIRVLRENGFTIARPDLGSSAQMTAQPRP